MTELDKFKRRLIRSVARLQQQKKKQRDEIWEDLKKETGCDCKLLWDRMRALTLKKLNRLLLADDIPENVPAIARLSNTDWLLFDLVLVHEKIDVITIENRPAESKGELKPLVELFSLVQRLNIEGLNGESLAEAWAAATIYYNKEGRECSPMLLQRRWYQLKESTRRRFYDFWFSYRGNAHLLMNAKKNAPSVLETAIAKRYPSIITSPFAEWEEMIQNKLIVLPEEFESNMRKETLPILGDPDGPDIVLVEQPIETIDLGMDSDSDEEKLDGKHIASDSEKSNEVQNIKGKGNELIGDKKEQSINITRRPYRTKDENTPIINSQISQHNVKVKIETPDNCEVIAFPADTLENILDDKKITGSNSDIDEVLLPKISSVYGNLSVTDENTPSCSFNDNNLIIESTEILETTIKITNVNPVVTESTKILTVSNNDTSIENCGLDIHGVVKETVADHFQNDLLSQAKISSSNEMLSSAVDVGDANKEKIANVKKLVSKLTTKSDEAETFKDLSADDILKQKAEEYFRKTQKDITNKTRKKATLYTHIQNLDSGLTTKSDEEAENITDLIVDDILNQRTENFIRKTQKEITSRSDENATVSTHIKKLDSVLTTKSDEDTETITDITAHDILKQKSEEFICKTEKEISNGTDEKAIISTHIKKLDSVLTTKSDEDTETITDLTAHDILKQRAEEFICKIEKEISNRTDDKAIISTQIKKFDSEHITKLNEESKITTALMADDIVKQKAEEYIRKTQNGIITNKASDITNTFNYTSTNWDLVEDGIELIDDGIEFVDEDETFCKNIKTEKLNQQIENEVEDSDTPKFDLKLLMDPVVYTTKLDLIDSHFKNIEFHTVKGEDLISNIIKKSKPLSKMSIEVKEIKVEHKDHSQQSISSTDKKDIDDLFKTEISDSNSDSEMEINEDRKVKPSSHLLQKPRSRSYNPIQLCKNPDFNTRLKRLPIGFFKSTRNLKLLKSCKPMTIDVHKAFETKLISGTLYLKSTSNDTKPYKKQDDQKSERNQTVTIVPSAMSVQSLIDNTIDDSASLTTVTSNQNILHPTEEALLSERRKVINLPDITNVRRINQRLLTAEVPPIVQQNSDETYKHVETETNGMRGNVENNEPQVSEHLLNSKDNTIFNLTVSNVTRFNNYNNMARTVNRHFASKIKLGYVPKRRVEVPWSTMNPVVERTNERLITYDTLEKVLHILSGNTTKNKNNSNKTKMQRATKESGANHKKHKGEKQKKDKLKCEKQKEGNQNDEEQNTNDVSLEQTKEVEVESKMKPKINLKSNIEHCCWYQDTIRNLKKPRTIRRLISKHGCPRLSCLCCCRNDFFKYIRRSKCHKGSIVVSDDEDNLGLQEEHGSNESVNQEKRACENIIDDENEGTINNCNLSVRDIAQESITMATPTVATVANTIHNDSLEGTIFKANVISPLNTNDNSLIEKVAVKSRSTVNEMVTEFENSLTTIIRPLPQVTTSMRDSILIENEKPPFIEESVSSFLEDPNVGNIQKQIVIDGSNRKCLVPHTVIPDNELNSYVMNLNPPTETPLCIGKNNILLTTVKLPKRNNSIDLGSKIQSTSPLPDGVQLIMQPTGELHLVVSPGVELTAEQLLALPDIVQEIQKQAVVGLNISNILNNSQTIDTATDEAAADENTSEISINSKEKERTTIEDNIPTCDLIDKNINAAESQKEVEPKEDSQKRTSKDINDENAHDNVLGCNLNQVKSVESNNDISPTLINANISETTENKTTNLEYKDSSENDNNASMNRKTILSDLMEMSGISSEDTIISQENATSQTLNSCEQILPSSSDNSDTTVISKIPELSVLTSFTELKYACENNGEFFRLDFSTGVLLPVKVCVKKTLKKSTDKKIPPNTVIDLTKDNEVSNEHVSAKRKRKCKTKVVRNLFHNVSTPPHPSANIKPLKLFKAIHPIILKRIKVGKRNANTICYDKDEKRQTQNKKRQRKQKVNKIEAKIDLVDSDAPMEEEYLVESDFGEEIEATMKKKQIETDDTLDDSSDDEPLAKKSKRIREIKNLSESNNCKVSEETIDNNLQNNLLVMTENKKAENSNASTSAVLDVSNDTTLETAQYIENEESENHVAITFLANGSDTECSPEDDCILGV